MELKSFAFGGIAGCVAATTVQPLDLLKTRSQLSGTNVGVLGLASGAVREEGLLALWRGLSAALLRQTTYTSARMGVFQTTMNYSNKHGVLSIWIWICTKPHVFFIGLNVTFAHRIAFGAMAGAVAGVVGNPAEVCLVRMTADARLPKEQRRNYRHVFDALARIVRVEGITTLFRGTTATVSRSVLLNSTQLGVYSQAKASLSRYGHMREMSVHASAGMISGLACTIVSLPADMAKTQVQQMIVGPDGTRAYRGPLDVIVKMVSQQGLFSLWRGFIPYYLRLGPHTIISFMVLEQLNNLFGGRRSSM